MATFKHSGYLAAASAVVWTSGQGLNSLTNNEWTDLTDEIDNSVTLYETADFYMDLASVAFTGSRSSIAIYIVPSVDGTNYPNWTGNTTVVEPENAQYYVTSLLTSQATEAQKMTCQKMPLPQGKFKFGFRSTAGIALAASGNNFYWRPTGRSL